LTVICSRLILWAALSSGRATLAPYSEYPLWHREIPREGGPTTEGCQHHGVVWCWRPLFNRMGGLDRSDASGRRRGEDYPTQPSYSIDPSGASIAPSFQPTGGTDHPLGHWVWIDFRKSLCGWHRTWGRSVFSRTYGTWHPAHRPRVRVAHRNAQSSFCGVDHRPEYDRAPR
jgi:hypothetical protein